MTTDELRAHCRRQMEIIESEDPRVLLVLPGKWGRAEHKRLAGRSGPLGRVVSEVERGVLVDFKAREILAWLNRAERKEVGT